jgi:hypothetical protein
MPTISLTSFSFMKQIGGKIAALHRPTAAGVRAYFDPISPRDATLQQPQRTNDRPIHVTSDNQAFHHGGVSNMAHQEQPQQRDHSETAILVKRQVSGAHHSAPWSGE